MSETEHRPELEAEVEYLRARVAELEAQLLATERWGSQTVAQAQESLYWLERWGVNLNAVMDRPGAEQFRRGVRGVRQVYRAGLRLSRRLRQA
jgi:hypothetical protein